MPEQGTELPRRTETFYEVHGEHDGHVNGSRDRESAERLVENYEQMYEQEHYIVEVEEVVA